MATKDRNERCKVIIPLCINLSSQVDSDYLHFLCKGDISQKLPPLWLADPLEERDLEKIALEPDSYFGEAPEHAAKEIYLRRRIRSDLKQWIEKWMTPKPIGKKGGRPAIKPPSIVATLLRDHFIERTGKPNYHYVGLMIWALFPNYIHKRLAGGGSTRRDPRKVAEDLCERESSKKRTRPSDCYYEHLRIYRSNPTRVP